MYLKDSSVLQSETSPSKQDRSKIELFQPFIQPKAALIELSGAYNQTIFCVQFEGRQLKKTN